MGNRVYTLCVQTEKLVPADMGGAISRCVVVKPRYLVHNGITNTEVFIRQHKVIANDPICVQPGETIPLYWWESAEPKKLLFEFKPGSSLGYSWYVT